MWWQFSQCFLFQLLLFNCLHFSVSFPNVSCGQQTMEIWSRRNWEEAISASQLVIIISAVLSAPVVNSYHIDTGETFWGPAQTSSEHTHPPHPHKEDAAQQYLLVTAGEQGSNFMAGAQRIALSCVSFGTFWGKKIWQIVIWSGNVAQCIA